MSSVNTIKLSRKLERIIEFRVGENASQKHKIVLESGSSCPATDGTKIFLPSQVRYFSSVRDNELSIANSTAHEADHIREMNEYFGEEIDSLRNQNESLVEEYHERNYSDLNENPALAGWIDNIVKDRRIDSQRREQLPGIKKHYEEVLIPAAEYLRPSIKGMSELDAFREQYLQKALLGRVVEPISKKHKDLLEDIVSLTSTASSIEKDKEVVTRIYQMFKENFNITQPISRLPSLFGTGDHSQSKTSSTQRGYGRETKPREGRSPKEKRPSTLDGEKEKLYRPNEDKIENKGNENEQDIKDRNKNSANPYQQIQEKCKIGIHVVEPQFNSEMIIREEEFRNRYAGEIESMKAIFRQLKLKHYGDRRDHQGQELSYEDYMQSDLESKVTGIMGGGKHFKSEIQNKHRPAFGIHADVSGSTKGEIIEQIKGAFYIVGNALSASDWDYGLYASADHLHVLKEPTKKWDDAINHSILALNAGGEGIYLSSTSQAISEDLRRTNGNPKCLIVISDFEVCGEKSKERKIARTLQEQKVYPFYIAIGGEHEIFAKEMTEEIGDEHYSVISANRLYELPNEIFRLFKTFGVSK